MLRLSLNAHGATSLLDLVVIIFSHFGHFFIDDGLNFNISTHNECTKVQNPRYKDVLTCMHTPRINKKKIP